MDMTWCMSEKSVSKVRKCTFCGKIEKNQKIEWARSVFTGKWVCMKCFNEKIRNG